MTSVYLDHNSTSPMRPEVFELWVACQGHALGNPSSLHTSGRRARHLVDEARERVAHALAVHEDEVVFTSSGTESNNLAIRGDLGARRGCALITSEVEHSSVLSVARAVADEGYATRLIPPDTAGRVDASDVRAAVDSVTGPALVSLQTANNETGTVQRIADVLEALRTCPRRPTLHTDGVQALGRIPVELREWQVDLASFSAHKIGGPTGVGVLYRRNGVVLAPLMQGGGQELGLRPGTENVAAIAAAGLAIEIAIREQSDFRVRVARLADELWNDLRAALDGVRLIGPDINASDRLPNTVTIVLPNTDGKVLVTALDVAGLEVSAGSACASGSVEPSHVLLAMKLDDASARAGLRLSLGWNTSRDDCKRAVDILRKVAGRSRAT
jgi:cysteine desulfurase